MTENESQNQHAGNDNDGRVVYERPCLSGYARDMQSSSQNDAQETSRAMCDQRYERGLESYCTREQCINLTMP